MNKYEHGLDIYSSCFNLLELSRLTVSSSVDYSKNDVKNIHIMMPIYPPSVYTVIDCKSK